MTQKKKLSADLAKTIFNSHYGGFEYLADFESSIPLPDQSIFKHSNTVSCFNGCNITSKTDNTVKMKQNNHEISREY